MDSVPISTPDGAISCDPALVVTSMYHQAVCLKSIIQTNQWTRMYMNPVYITIIYRDGRLWIKTMGPSVTAKALFAVTLGPI